MNRLLVNMKNKVEILNGAIKMCDQLANGESIHLKGFYEFDVSKGKNSKEDMINRKYQLIEERHNLIQRIERMSKNTD
jgi:hypothetical protein